MLRILAIKSAAADSLAPTGLALSSPLPEHSKSIPLIAILAWNPPRIGNDKWWLAKES